MEKTEKNKKMIIIVRCLLLVVGVSLAYFLANSLINGDVTSLKATTAHIHGATLTMEGTLEFSDKNILPGHKNVSILKLTATGNNEVIPYNVVWKGSNNLNTPLNFTVYKAGVKLEVTSSCHQVTGKVNGMNIINEECTISNETNLGTAIATGTIENRGGEDTYSLVDDEIITATSAGTEMYYYVVLEYPETGEDQSSDMGGTFTGEVMVTESNVSPDINILAVYTKDDGDADYKKVEAIPQSGYTLNTSKSNCTNGATPSWDYDHNGLLTTNLTQSGTSCYLYFDKQIITANTIIANLSGTPTDDSMFSGTSGDGIYTWTKGDYSGGEQPIKYFRGNVNNNWVIFGKDGSNYIWWRIIRNNSNGSL